MPIPEIKMEIQNEVPFYGIFATDLPQRCFSSDGKLVYFSTPKINNLCTYCVDLGKISRKNFRLKLIL